MSDAGIDKQLLRRGNNDRINGWMEVRKYLSEASDGKPWLQFFNTCTMAVKTIPAQVHDATNQEDLDSDNEFDDWADAARYGVMTRMFRKQGAMLKAIEGESTKDLLKKTFEVKDGTMPNIYAELIKRQLQKRF
jgi:hypothetical protein